MANSQQVNFRLSEQDTELVRRAAGTLGLSVSGLCMWSARMYAMAVLVNSTPSLQGKVREVLEQSLGEEDREEVVARFSADFARFEKLLREMQCDGTR